MTGPLPPLPQEPVAWFRAPYGTLEPNPLFRVSGPQTLEWAIACFTEDQMRDYARAALAAAQPSATSAEPASLIAAREALFEVDDFIARVNGDDRGSDPHVNMLRTFLNSCAKQVDTASVARRGVTLSINAGMCKQCGKWAGAHATLPGQSRDHLCMCQPQAEPVPAPIYSKSVVKRLAVQMGLVSDDAPAVAAPEPVAWSPRMSYPDWQQHRVWANGAPRQADIDYWNAQPGCGIDYAYAAPAPTVVPLTEDEAEALIPHHPEHYTVWTGLERRAIRDALIRASSRAAAPTKP